MNNDNFNWLDKQFDYKKHLAIENRINQFEYKQYQKTFQSVSSEEIEKHSFKRALSFFKYVSKNVPAYKDFLKKNKIDPEKIQNQNDFNLIPWTDKENYISKYSLEDRSFGGGNLKNNLIAISSGTTGNPTLWARSAYQEYEAFVFHQKLFIDQFEVHKKTTLVLIGFPMGVYVSGIATLLPTWLLTQKYPGLSVVSVGNNKADMLKAMEQLSYSYDQTILVGHPFFLKDVIETATARKIKLDKFNISLMFCSEGFSEDWREYVSSVLNPKGKVKAINTYGSSEFLLMANENQRTIDFRKAVNGTALGDKLFGSRNVPSLFEYNPYHRYLQESSNGEILCTAVSGVPLIRYNMHDAGKIISAQQFNLYSRQLNLKPTKSNLPIVVLQGRSDYGAVFYAANIYPNNIHAALQHDKLFKKLTGKFSLEKKYKNNMDEDLVIHIELQDKALANKDLLKFIKDNVIKTLSSLNLEYQFLQKNLDKNIDPKIKLHAYQHPKYFKPGLKPRYIV